MSNWSGLIAFTRRLAKCPVRDETLTGDRGPYSNVLLGQLVR